tara:strand:- start:1170 stop:1307 length:138 start_codon:yes stop_codon:yes gene_type:complete
MEGSITDNTLSWEHPKKTIAITNNSDNRIKNVLHYLQKVGLKSLF